MEGKKSPTADPDAPAAPSAGNDDNEAVPVVGIGASAGGLEAFKALLQGLPDEIGMAFLLVQHLAPTRESLLSEIMSRETRLRVQEAEDGAWLATNHIYVAPPDCSLALRGGRLALTQRSSRDAVGSQHSSELPIDFMLRSLADEVGPAAIGVVLSGTASDGTLGLKAIKAAGGMTFAQDEATAQYFGMPGNAIASGAVDFVLPPAEIARELGRIARHPYLLDRGRAAGEDDLDASAEEMKEIFALLRARAGHDFSYYKHATIKRRVKRRMLLSKLERFRDYLEYLRTEPAEVDALFHDITINVTGFFREPQTFESLRNNVLPALLKDRPSNDTLRIWVPGCSSGEEPYSLAMVLLEELGPQPRIPVQIFGTDIDEQAIERARSGIYPSRISSELSQGRLNRFFHESAAGWQINKSVRSLCVFAPHNVTSDPPFSRLDLICCRNLMIYLGSTLQRRVLQIFHYALNPNGFLMLGASEGIGGSSDLFSLEDKEAKVYAKQSNASTPTYDFAPTHRGRGQESRDGKHESGGLSESDIRKEADRTVLTLFGPPGVIVSRDLSVLSFRGKTGRYLEPLPGTASLDLVKLVRQELLVDLRNLFKRALKSDEPVIKMGIELKVDGRESQLSLRVIPLAKEASERFYLILFEEHPIESAASEDRDEDESAVDRSEGDTTAGSETDQARIAKLEKELEETREYMQSIIEDQESTNEELQSANEEVQSTNEELQSTNEELETAKEELQSTNEELATVNDELEHRNTELTVTNNDLRNLLSSVNLPILMLDRDLRVRQFTPRAKRLFNLIDADVGRPIGNLRPSIDLPRLEALAHEVMDSMAVKKLEVDGEHNAIKDVTLRPYRTHDQRIDGVVITVFDRDAPAPD